MTDLSPDAEQGRQLTGILDLPAELLLHVLSFLPLSATFIFRLQTCKALRDSVALGRLRVPGPNFHTLSLVDWQVAAGEIKRLGLLDGPDEVEEDEQDEAAAVAAGIASGSGKNASKNASSSRPAVPNLSSLDSARPSDFPTWSQHIPTSSSKAGAPRHEETQGPQPRPLNHRDPAFLARSHALAQKLACPTGLDPVADAKLFRRVLHFLGFIDRTTSPFPEVNPISGREFRPIVPLAKHLRPWAVDDGEKDGDGPRLKCVSLISWFGVNGSHVLSLLVKCPGFARVKLCIKTERYDEGIWRNLALKSIPPMTDDAQSARVNWEPPTRSTITIGNHSPAYTETQLSVKVGSKDEEAQIKGKGLFAGYLAYCFHNSTHDDDKEEPFHLVFQGRFHAQQAIETQEMFELSSLQCKHCNRDLSLS